MCERDRVVKRVRRGGSRKPDGCLITCLAIWTVVTELLNPIHHRKCVKVFVCVCVKWKATAFLRARALIFLDVCVCVCALFHMSYKSAKMLIRTSL